ncbi:MAG: hypothetical protein RI554_10815 [Trueperaceae bacterium]|nr:hypothetical protein [Trueperaceae bacterium]
MHAPRSVLTLSMALFVSGASMAWAQVSASDTTQLDVGFTYVSTIVAPGSTSLAMDGVDADGEQDLANQTVQYSFATSQSDLKVRVLKVGVSTTDTTSPVDTFFYDPNDSQNSLRLGVVKADGSFEPLWDASNWLDVTLDGNDGSTGVFSSVSNNEVGEFVQDMTYRLKRTGAGPAQNITTDIELQFTVSDP